MRKQHAVIRKIMAGFGLAAVMLAASATGVKAAGNVAVDAKNFPDKAFRIYISEYVDTDKNGALSKTEIAKATYIDLMYMDIKNLKGIQYFTNLEELICNGNKLTKLDVSKNIKLTMLNCTGNQLTKLDLSKNKKLRYLYCDSKVVVTGYKGEVAHP